MNLSLYAGLNIEIFNESAFFGMQEYTDILNMLLEYDLWGTLGRKLDH